MECKDEKMESCLLFRKDLIDTLWNVKAELHKAVNTLRGRFNRYIVECKEAMRAVLAASSNPI